MDMRASIRGLPRVTTRNTCAGRLLDPLDGRHHTTGPLTSGTAPASSGMVTKEREIWAVSA